MNRHRFIITISLLVLFSIGFGIWGTIPTVFSQDGQDTSAYVAEVVALTNVERQKEGLQLLAVNELLNMAAQGHAEAMAEHDFFSHDDPVSATSASDRISAVGYEWTRVAENIAAGAKTPAEVVEGWMNSSGHRKNILDPELTEIGVGYYYDEEDTYPQANAPYRSYWVQNFGTSVSNFAVVTPSSPQKPVASGGDEAITISKQLRPESALVGDEVEVLITLQANDVQCDTELVEQPVDIVLLIDRSTSMLNVDDNGEKSKFDIAKEAAIAFVDSINTENASVAVIVFDGRGSVIQGITNSVPSLKSSIQNLPIGDNRTAIYEGLQVATRELLQYGRSNVSKSIVLLSDGANFIRDDQTPEEREVADVATKNEADKAKTNHIRIISVGLGESIDRKLLKEVATTKKGSPEFYHSPDASDLAEIYVSIAQEIQESAQATSLRVTHVFDPAKIQIASDTISHQGILSGGTAPNTLTWEIETLGSHALILSYRAKLKQAGQFVIDNGEQLEYVFCKNTYTTSIPPGLEVQAQAPTPTPTFTPIPTHTPTPTITPTSGIFGAPTPTPEAGLSGIIPSPSIPSFCSNQLWWLPALLLPFLLMLLILLFLWWLARRNHISLGNLWREWRWPCRILSLLLLLFLLFLVFLIGRELFVGSCQPAEAVYFWRMDPQTGDSGIFLTTNNDESGPLPFKSVNRGRCVGCHAVSSQSHQIAAVDGPIPGRSLVYSLAGERVDIPDAAATFYAWSPDGNKLAYADSVGDIYILDLEAESEIPLQGASEPGVSETMPSWSPDGSTIAFVRSNNSLGVGGASVEGQSDIYTVPAIGGQPQMLPGASGGMNYYPAYSPDSKWLAFTRHTTGGRSYSDDAAEIFLLPATGGNAIRLEANDAADGSPLQNVSNSWPTWSEDGHLLAFNSKRTDPYFDVFVTEIDENGHSGPAIPLPGASQQNVFEHTPFWGEPLQSLPLWQRLLNLWPWLIPLLLLGLLRWLLCRKAYVLDMPPSGILSTYNDPPDILTQWRPLPPNWHPAPTLVIGLGGTGRKVLTHLKKNLKDAGLGTWQDQVKLLLLDNAAEEVIGGRKLSVEVTGIQLDPDEVMIIGDDLRQIVRSMADDPDFEPEMQPWFPADEYARVRSLPDAQMDIRKTTSQRRPMGRAIAFKDIQEGESSKLWQGLTQAMRQLSHDGQVRILMIGSLGGGFGSGVMTDVAYLARQAALENASTGGAVLSAFLATDNVFVSHTRSQQIQLNTKATLRELGRFLLAGGRPFPMTYKKGSHVRSLDGYIEWSLFDEVFLFDGQRPVKPLTLVEPEIGMFPLMADIAQTFIDQESQLMEEVRSNLRTTAATVQVKEGDAVVSTLGAYTYRLPMNDIVRGLMTRFSHDLVLLYLAGPDNEGGQIHLTASLARKETRYPGGVPTMVSDFLRGQLHGHGEGAGAESNFVADLSEGRGSLTEWRGLTSSDTHRHQDHFCQTLKHLLLQVLNGQAGEIDMIQARSGKLGYAQAFLNELQTTLKRAQDHLEFLSSRATDDEKGASQALSELITAEIEIAEAARKQLQSGVTFLLGETDTRPGSNSEAARGVLSLLQEKLAQEEEWREEIRQVEVRKTFIDEQFVDKLYKRYFSDFLGSKGLEALYWREEKTGDLVLSVYLEGHDVVALEATRANREQFVETLVELASSLGEAIWRLRLDDFFDDRDTGLWAEENSLYDEVREATAWAEPTATVRVAAASQQEPSRYLWVNETVKSRDGFARQVQLQTNMRTAVQRLNATDPYSATLLTSLDILPLSAFDCTNRVGETYRNAYGIGDSYMFGDNHSYPEPVHVFAAEQHALLYERRLTDIREAPRLFHPLFVAALEDLDKAHAFALAYVLQWVRRERYQEKGEPSERYILMTPGMESIPLTRSDHPNDSVALIVRAMQSFVLGKPASEATHIAYDIDDLTSIVKTALSAQKTHLRQALRDISGGAKPDDLVKEMRLGADDFWSFVRLVAIEELKNM